MNAIRRVPAAKCSRPTSDRVAVTIPSSGAASCAPRADSCPPTNAREPAFRVRFPIRTVSELNKRGHENHWKRHKRSSEQRWIVSLILGARKTFHFPVTVRLTRLAPRKLDAGDNLNSFAKSIRDQIAAWLDVNDGDETKVTWLYAQEQRPQYGVFFELWESP